MFSEANIQEVSLDLAKRSAWRQRTAMNLRLGIFGITHHILSSFDHHVDLGIDTIDRAGELITQLVSTTSIQNDRQE